MESGINLLPQLTEAELKKGVYRRKINMAAFVTLAIVGVIIILLFAYQIFLKLRADSIESQTQAATAKIHEFKDVEIVNLALKQKLDKITDYLTKEIPKSSLVEQVGNASVTNPAIKITNIQTDEKGKIIVEGTAVNSASFHDWIVNLTNDTGKDYFANIDMTSLSGDRANGYKFVFSMDFLKKGVYKTR